MSMNFSMSVSKCNGRNIKIDSSISTVLRRRWFKSSVITNALSVASGRKWTTGDRLNGRPILSDERYSEGKPNPQHTSRRITVHIDTRGMTKTERGKIDIVAFAFWEIKIIKSAGALVFSRKTSMVKKAGMDVDADTGIVNLNTWEFVTQMGGSWRPT